MQVSAARSAAAFEGLWRQFVVDSPDRFWRRLDDGVVAFVSEIPAPSMNGVFVFREDADVETVGSSLLEVARAGVPFCLQARPALRGALAGVAADLGMVAGDDVPLMVLEDQTALAHFSNLDGFSVRLLEDGEPAVHEDLLAAGFEMPADMAHSLMELFGGAPGLRAFVGEAEPGLVTTALIVPSADRSVAVFNVATPPEHRRRGYGAAITAAAVLDSFDRGATFAWLQSSPAGLAVYQGLGFRVVESWPVWTSPEGH